MKYVFSTTLALALLTSAPALAQDKIDVMTQNQYLGADLTPIVVAAAADPFDPVAFNEAIVDALKQVAANDFPTRAGLLATLIANRLPELVGLQEAFIFTCDDPPFDPPYHQLPLPPTPDNEGCDNPDIRNAFNNHLALTLAALAALGESYDAVAKVKNLDTRIVTLPPPPLPPNTPFPPGIPFTIDGYLAVANIIDFDVILVRTDVVQDSDPPVTPVGFPCAKPSVDGCNYQAVAPAPLPGFPNFAIERGYVGVDVNIDGQDYRFVDTHLEVQEPQQGNPVSSFFQAAQALELIGTLKLTTPPRMSLIVVGDINSSSEDLGVPGPLPLPLPFNQGIVPPYTQFLSVGGLPAGYIPGGYTDAWTVTGDIPGFSCCQLSDLSNISSIHDERIDVIFPLDEPNKAKKKRVLGSQVPDKSAPDGLWPSDHGSVAVELQFD